MTSVAESTAQATQFAESFLRRVQTEYPHLIGLGWKQVISASIQGMKELGIYNDNLTEGTFLAGLRHSMDTGVLPKPPEPEAPELATRSISDTSSRDRAESTRPALEGAKSVMSKLREQVAQREAESLQCWRADGRVDHGKSESLRQIFAYRDAAKTQIWWTKTLELRKAAQDGFNNESRNKRDRY